MGVAAPISVEEACVECKARMVIWSIFVQRKGGGGRDVINVDYVHGFGQG